MGPCGPLMGRVFTSVIIVHRSVGAGVVWSGVGAFMAARVALLSYLRRGVLRVVHLRSKDKLCPLLLEQDLVSLRNVVCF